jgi:hypothetical protein
VAPPAVHDTLASPGAPLAGTVRAEMEQRLGHDFSRVRVHTDARAAGSAQAVRASAYTVGQDVVFGPGRYAPATGAGKELLAHELVHTAQQRETAPAPGAPLEVGAPGDAAEREAHAGATARSEGPVLRREPIYPDATCDSVKDNITRAWPTARAWAREGSRRMGSPRDVAGALGRHFKIDPTDAAQAADVAHVQQVLARMVEIFDMDVSQVCEPPNHGEGCSLPDGRAFAAYITWSGHPEVGIHHCITSADHGLLMGEDLIDALVHEVAHLADAVSTDVAYHHQPAYQTMTRAQALTNGDSYSELARELYEGGTPRSMPMVFTGGTGLLVGNGQARPQWAITAGFDFRSRTGLEVFDLVGGFRTFVGVGDDPTSGHTAVRTIGGSLDFGIMSRAPQTGFFVDTRAGVYGTIGTDFRDPATAGITARTLIGWANSGFRVGLDTRLLFDLVNANHGVLIGLEIGGQP